MSPRPGLQPRAFRVGIVAESLLLGEVSVRVGILLFSHASNIPGMIGIHPPWEMWVVKHNCVTEV